MTNGFLGVDVSAVEALTQNLSRSAMRLEDCVHLVLSAEVLCEVPTSVVPRLDEVGSSAAAMAVALRTAVDELRGFELPAIHRLNQVALASQRVDDTRGDAESTVERSTSRVVIDPAEALALQVDVGAEVDDGYATLARRTGQSYEEVVLAAALASAGHDPTPAGSVLRASIARSLWSIDPHHRGDLAGTMDTEVRSPYPSFDGDAGTRGRQLVQRALADTGDSHAIRVDEFGAVLLETGAVVLVLPGVTDLSSFISFSPPGLPGLGYDSDSRTVRDLDRHAVRSSRSTEVDDNEYAVLIRHWVDQQVRAGVIARGADTLIVGHSFGADTALDLAADPTFNGDLVTLRHVVAAGYHSEPQLPHVPSATSVLALQNIYDVAVIAEGLGAGDAGDVVAPLAKATTDAVVDTAVDTAPWWMPFGLGTIAQHADVDIDVSGDTITSPADQQIVVEFEGGFTGAGHHQANYLDYIDRSIAVPLLDAFFADIGATFDSAGVMLGIDVSVPAEISTSVDDDRPNHRQLGGFGVPEPGAPLDPMVPFVDPIAPVVEPLTTVVDPFAPLGDALDPFDLFDASTGPDGEGRDGD